MALLSPGVVIGPDGIFDQSCPVNWAHQLNNGRLFWWKVMRNPGWSGGLTVHDLVRGSGHLPYDGAGTALLWSGPHGGTGGANLGGFGCFGKFNGTTTKIVSNNNWAGQASKLLTVACWVNTPTTGRADCVNVFNNGTSGATLEVFGLLFGVTAGKPQFYFSSGTVLNNSGVGTTVMSINTGYRLVGTYNGSIVAVYLNGVLQSSAASSVTLGSGTAQAIRGGQNAAGGGPFAGYIDDCTVFNQWLRDEAQAAQEKRNREEAERQRLEALRPDAEKIRAFGTLAAKTIGDLVWPGLSGPLKLTSPEALAFIDKFADDLSAIFERAEKFGV